MIDPGELRELRERRFPELALNCGRAVDPGIEDQPQWRDWTLMDTTPDQLRIENYLDSLPLRGKRILHVGVGNSGLAVRFAGRTAEIVGTTVVAEEVAHGNGLAIGNYRVLLHNKYSGKNEPIAGAFDFIVDNNPTTFCCCLRHLGDMLDFYASKLAPHGQVVTDRVGLGWTTSAAGANPRWAFSFDDLAQAAALAGLRAYRMNKSTYVLAFEQPRRPSAAGKLSNRLRAIARRLLRRLKRVAGIR